MSNPIKSKPLQSKMFTTTLAFPGRVNILKFGTVELHKLSEAKLIEIHESGLCPNLLLTYEGMKKYKPKFKKLEVKKAGEKGPKKRTGSGSNKK